LDPNANTQHLALVTLSTTCTRASAITLAGGEAGWLCGDVSEGGVPPVAEGALGVARLVTVGGVTLIVSGLVQLVLAFTIGRGGPAGTASAAPA
jgi:hypothetical protein